MKNMNLCYLIVLRKIAFLGLFITTAWRDRIWLDKHFTTNCGRLTW